MQTIESRRNVSIGYRSNTTLPSGPFPKPILCMTTLPSRQTSSDAEVLLAVCWIGKTFTYRLFPLVLPLGGALSPPASETRPNASGRNGSSLLGWRRSSDRRLAVEAVSEHATNFSHVAHVWLMGLAFCPPRDGVELDGSLVRAMEAKGKAYPHGLARSLGLDSRFSFRWFDT